MKKTLFTGSSMALGWKNFAHAAAPIKKTSSTPKEILYRSVNASASSNIKKVVELLGGIESIIGSNDIVVIKPNIQWWNQGAPNLSALKRFIDLIFDYPEGFSGEVVIAENCHRGPHPWLSVNSGWTRKFTRNSDIPNVNNFNELCAYLKKKYTAQFSVCHWIDVAAGAKRVYSPNDGPGYVYCDGTGGVPLISLDNGAKDRDYRSVIMTYPLFKTDTGTMIDFKNGIWNNGHYTDQPLKFINFPALNYHSTFCGATSSIKNYLGISDLSGGSDPSKNGKLSGEFYNFHSFAFNWSSPGPKPGMLGAEVATFMNTIRKADLNITTAECIGLSSRTETPIAHPKAVLACTDPVALDYHAAKYILFPNSRISLHNPDNPRSPFYEYLKKCADISNCILDESLIKVVSYDHDTNTLQDDNNLVARGKKEWGLDLKALAKYFFLRYSS